MMAFMSQSSSSWVTACLLLFVYGSQCAPTQTNPCNSHNRDPCATFPDLCSAGGGLCVVKGQTCEYQCVCPPDGRVGRDCTSSTNHHPARQMGSVVESLVIFPDLFQDINHVAKSHDFRVNVSRIATTTPATTTTTTTTSTTTVQPKIQQGNEATTLSEHTTMAPLKTSSASQVTSTSPKDASSSSSTLETTVATTRKMFTAQENFAADIKTFKESSAALEGQTSTVKVTTGTSILAPHQSRPFTEPLPEPTEPSAATSARQTKTESSAPSTQTSNATDYSVHPNRGAQEPVQDIRQVIKPVTESPLAPTSNTSEVPKPAVITTSLEKETSQTVRHSTQTGTLIDPHGLSQPSTTAPTSTARHNIISSKAPPNTNLPSVSPETSTTAPPNNANNGQPSTINEEFPVLFTETIGNSHDTQGTGVNSPLSVLVERVYFPLEPFQRSGR